MKKIVCFILTLVMILMLSACGNKGLGYGNFSFKHVHISDGVNGHCATVEKWYDSEGDGIEIKTTEYGAIWCSEGTYILYESASKCPHCH